MEIKIQFEESFKSHLYEYSSSIRVRYVYKFDLFN